ncbi:Serpin B3 [Araneus ventricosus]|uniref:Serpin B3 n=1 Tax=Araneus ventricosus TaxID=182803 RepID=A0A4Y2KQ76_ARAVE|nr:Serpin B3 [Araneus ventricosus]
MRRDGYVLNSANSILVDKRLELLEEYRRNVQELYRATVRNVDFAREGPRLVKEINDWVKEKTNGKIEKLLQQLSPATALVLLNAVYFKGTWETQFDPKKTKDGVFYNNGLKSEAKNVPMMKIETELPMASFPDFKALELPYKGENVSMLILLPRKPDGLQALEESLTPEKLANVQERMHPSWMSISLPKFKLEFEKELSGPLQALGANQIFSTGPSVFKAIIGSERGREVSCCTVNYLSGNLNHETFGVSSNLEQIRKLGKVSHSVLLFSGDVSYVRQLTGRKSGAPLQKANFRDQEYVHKIKKSSWCSGLQQIRGGKDFELSKP